MTIPNSCRSLSQSSLLVSFNPHSIARVTQSLLRNIVVVEITHNSEAGKAALLHNACHLSDAMNPHFVTLIWRGDKNLYPDLGARWRELFAADERPIERNIAGKPALRMITFVIPVENHRKAQLVSHGRPALRIDFFESCRTELHS